MTQSISIGGNIENLPRIEPNVKRQPFLKITIEQIRELEPILKFLNKKDRDILYLIFVAQKKQKEVQRILGRSQPSLCYDIQRIRSRLKFIVYLFSVFDIFLDFLIHRADKLDFGDGAGAVELKREAITVLVLLFYTTSFTQTAKLMGKPQIRARYLFEKTLQIMEQQQMWDVFEIFSAIRENLNIVRRVYIGQNRFNEQRVKIF